MYNYFFTFIAISFPIISIIFSQHDRKVRTVYRRRIRDSQWIIVNKDWIKRVENVFLDKDYAALMKIGEITRRAEDILNMSS